MKQYLDLTGHQPQASTTKMLCFLSHIPIGTPTVNKSPQGHLPMLAAMDRKCVNCGTMSTSQWRSDKTGHLCNACSHYYEKRGINRPLISQLPIKLRYKRLTRMDRSCANCQTNTTLFWHYNAKKEPMCNACNSYIQRYKVPRPPALWTVGIPPKRRKLTNNNSNSSKSPPLWRPWLPTTNNTSSSSNIATMADRINLPQNIVDRTNNLFKQVYEQKSLKGRANDAIASACLYIACRQEGVPRTFKEICSVSRISKKKIGRCFKLILKALKTSVDLITTGDFMSRFCSNLCLPKQVQMAATHIARKAVELDLVPGRSPISVAATAIYMASQASAKKRTQKEIGDIAGVADVTISQCYRLIYPRAPDLFPSDFKFDTPVDKLQQL